MGYRQENADEDLSGPVLLEFGVSWCPHCQAMEPEVERILPGHPAVRHVKIEDGPGRALGRRYRVKLWPNFVVMKDGEVLAQLARPSAPELREALVSSGL